MVVKCRPCTAEEADDAVGNAGGITLPGDGRVSARDKGNNVSLIALLQAEPVSSSHQVAAGLLLPVESSSRLACVVVLRGQPIVPVLLLLLLQIVLGKEFEADHVYLPSDGDAVYQDEVQTLVGSLYEGINSTVFAYGEWPCSRRSCGNTIGLAIVLKGRLFLDKPAAERLVGTWQDALTHAACSHDTLCASPTAAAQVPPALARRTPCWAVRAPLALLTASLMRCLGATTSAHAPCLCQWRSCTA